MKKQWKSFSEIQLKRFRLLREHRHLISEQLIVLLKYVISYSNTTQTNCIVETFNSYRMFDY